MKANDWSYSLALVLIHWANFYDTSGWVICCTDLKDDMLQDVNIMWAMYSVAYYR